MKFAKCYIQIYFFSGRPRGGRRGGKLLYLLNRYAYLKKQLFLKGLFPWSNAEIPT